MALEVVDFQRFLFYRYMKTHFIVNIVAFCNFFV